MLLDSGGCLLQRHPNSRGRSATPPAQSTCKVAHMPIHAFMHRHSACRSLCQVPARQPTDWRASTRVGCGRLVHSAGAADHK